MKDGKILYSVPAEDLELLLFDQGKKLTMFRLDNDDFIGIDMLTGDVRWKSKLKDDYGSFFQISQLDDKRLFLVFKDNILLFDSQNGSLIMNTEFDLDFFVYGGGFHYSAFIRGPFKDPSNENVVYFTSNGIIAIDSKSGKTDLVGRGY